MINIVLFIFVFFLTKLSAGFDLSPQDSFEGNIEKPFNRDNQSYFPEYLNDPFQDYLSFFYKSSTRLIAEASPYEKNPQVAEYIWNTLEPYFVPEYSKEKIALDTIFQEEGVLKSIKTLNRAGFHLITNPKSKIIVLSHSDLKGYLFKVYLESENIPEWDCWLRRARGSRVIQDAINEYGYEHIMKVPRKWIYPLPQDKRPLKEGTFRKYFVLLVEKMDILSYKKNKRAFKTKVNQETLIALYTLLTENLLIDSVYADNIPFCKDGRIAFVDTEFSGDRTRDVPLSAVGQYLSSDMLAVWEQLIINGVP